MLITGVEYMEHLIIQGQSEIQKLPQLNKNIDWFHGYQSLKVTGGSFTVYIVLFG